MAGVRARVFSLACLLSLMACGAILVFWARSYEHCAGIQWTAVPSVDRSDPKVYVPLAHTYTIEINSGLVHFLHTGPGTAVPGGMVPAKVTKEVNYFRWTVGASSDDDEAWAVLPPYLLPSNGFYLSIAEREMLLRLDLLVLPAWFVTLLGLVLPAWWVIRLFRKRKRRVRGHCHVCSYDLAGNTSGVCPECGAAVSVRG